MTINPSDPTKVAIFAANNGASYGLLQEVSTNGGNTWSYPFLIATGSSPYGLPAAWDDPQAAYDAVGNLFLCYVTANPNGGSIVLAKSRDSSSHSNRIYLAFADTQTTSTNDYDTDVYVMYSDTEGATWSQRQRVNDDATTNSQFFSGIAVDQTSGLVAFSWYDCRNDIGNTNTQFFATVSRDGFTTAQPRNFQLTTASSNSSPLCGCWGNFVNYGDYTGLAFYGGYFFPTWCSYANVTNCCGDVHTCRIAW